SDPETIQGSEEDIKFCVICLGILQFVHLDKSGKLARKNSAIDFAAAIADDVKIEGHQINSFYLEVSIPPTVIENENRVWLYIEKKFGSEAWFTQKFQSERTATKDFLKLTLSSLLETFLDTKSRLYDFRIRLTYTLPDESVKSQHLSERNGCSKRRKTGDSDIQKKDARVLEIEGQKFFERCSNELEYDGFGFLKFPVEKYSRNVSQSRWIIDDERKGEASVEEIIGCNMLPICHGDSYKFHAAGREDMDVLMLGTGRPFLVEIQNARQLPSDVLVKDMENKINSLESRLVRVKNLKVFGSQGWDLMREGEAEKQKQYAALVWISRPLTCNDDLTLSSHKDMAIQQRTPIRVLHRRSPLEREKVIHWMKIERIAAHSQYFLLHLCTQAGTYIKEFVHGDLGRTYPRVLHLHYMEHKPQRLKSHHFSVLMNMETEAPDSNPSQSPKTQEEQPPNPKRPKMSGTTSDDEDQYDNTAAVPSGEGENLTKKPRFKRRKVAIFFAYCGVGYQGMQKNPGAKTIEGELEEALYHSGAVPEADRGQHKRYDFARSARTDKGVSAVGQVVSGRFYVDPPGFVDRLNSHLSTQIRVFGYKRTTPSFSAKKFCDKRRYVYLIPVFALDPSCHRDRESVLASLGSANELVKCLQCSERGRKVVGLMGKRNSEFKYVSVDAAVGSGTSSNRGCALSEQNVAASSGNDIDDSERKFENGASETKFENVVTQHVEMEEDKVDLENVNANGVTNLENKSEFCFGEEVKERFNRILKNYVGTRNFHNFTSRIKAEDPSAKRYIMSFTADTTVIVDGIEFVKCEVVGQSFMLHQIRKMIGLAVVIMRNLTPESLFETVFEEKVNINVPMAPEVGLYLDECFFTSYNKRWKDSHEDLSLKCYSEEAEDFKMKYIYPHIASTEHKDGVVALWLHSLNYRNFPDLRAGDNSLKSADCTGNDKSTDLKHEELVS
ncbi:tRNA pseudouridine synthase A, mitochondrial, partial [Dorcoceras hygrometricum]